MALNLMDGRGVKKGKHDHMSEDNIYHFLSQVPLFASLPANEIQRMAELSVPHDYPKKTIVIQQGRLKMDCVYLIRSGKVKLYFEREGIKTQTTFLKEGEIFGAISLLMNSGIPVRSAEVIKDARCYAIPADIFLELSKKYGYIEEYFEDAFNRQMVDKAYAAIIVSNQALQFISGIIPFSFLPESEIEKICNDLSLIFYPKGTKILTQGLSDVESLYIIRNGAVERFFEGGNGNTLSSLMSEGEVFGGISMLINNSVSIRSLRTTEDTYFYIWPKQGFLAVCKQYPQFLEYFTDTFGKRMLDNSYASIVAKTMQPAEESLQFLNQPVDTIFQTHLVSCESGTSIQSAAELMSAQKCSSILVKTDDGRYAGIVTDSDLRQKVIARGLDIGSPVGSIMSSPLKTISSQALVLEALTSMMQENVKHLGVTGRDDEMVGIITNKDILTAQSRSPLFLIRQISSAVGVDDLKQQYRLLPGVVQALISNGAKSRNLTRLITTISDAILEKIIVLAVEKEGPPPCDFAFMVMGSEGRKEQTLKTDQDNAIIFDNSNGITTEAAQSYFLRLGETVCAWLDHVGFDFCKGDIMAKNPKWCQPLSVWKKYFLSWMRVAEPDDLLQSTIFFDFRWIHGNTELVDALRQYLMTSLSEWSFFFRHMAENAQQFKPPIGFFRNFIVESKGDHRDSFDIKKAMVPIIDYARIYALKNGISETNTQERLHQLYLSKVIGWDTYNEIEHAYSFLMQLRFARQINAVMVEKAPPDNYINPKKLTRIEQTMLKEIFSRIDTLQKEIGFGLFNG